MLNQTAGVIKRTFVLDEPAPAPKTLGGGQAQTVEQLAELLKNKVSGSVIQVQSPAKGDAWILLEPQKLFQSIQLLRDDPAAKMNVLHVVSAVDYVQTEPVAEGQSAIEPRIEVVYVLYSMEHKHQVMVKVKLPRENPSIQSITPLFRVANFQERECFDLLGVNFEGHLDLRRILLPDDWVGYPLRKDYVFPEEYNGMKVPL